MLRAALPHLLQIDRDQPHWGWTAGRRGAEKGGDITMAKIGIGLLLADIYESVEFTAELDEGEAN